MCETCLETGSAGSSWLPLALIRNANVQSVFRAAEEVQICLHTVTSAQNGSYISRCWATLRLWIKAIYKHRAKFNSREFSTQKAMWKVPHSGLEALSDTQKIFGGVALWVLISLKHFFLGAASFYLPHNATPLASLKGGPSAWLGSPLSARVSVSPSCL